MIGIYPFTSRHIIHELLDFLTLRKFSFPSIPYVELTIEGIEHTEIDYLINRMPSIYYLLF